MLREDIPGGRLLTLRRRRSRLPWMYSVYHVSRSDLRAKHPHACTACCKAREMAGFSPVLLKDGLAFAAEECRDVECRQSVHVDIPRFCRRLGRLRQRHG
jgi:hypothetical protein